MNQKRLQRQIMRRVYYSYALSVFSLTMFWQALFLGVSAGLLAHWLHVASIVHNFLSVPVGMAPRYITSAVLNALTHGEVTMVLVLLASGVVTILCAYRLVQVVRSHERMTVSM